VRCRADWQTNEGSDPDAGTSALFRALLQSRRLLLLLCRGWQVPRGDRCRDHQHALGRTLQIRPFPRGRRAEVPLRNAQSVPCLALQPHVTPVSLDLFPAGGCPHRSHGKQSVGRDCLRRDPVPETAFCRCAASESVSGAIPIDNPSRVGCHLLSSGFALVERHPAPPAPRTRSTLPREAL